MTSHERKTGKQMFHLTAMSNFARGFDKYTRRYSKASIPESSFPGIFFLLAPERLAPGLAKAKKLVSKLNLPGDRIIALSTHVEDEDLRNDHETGIGHYVPRDNVTVDKVFFVEDGELIPAVIEEVFALSLISLGTELRSWSDLTPRTISILPIGQACQADCKFCFSKASVSSEYTGRIKDWDRISSALQAAKKAGAERAVITGGGEPTLVKPAELLRLIQACGDQFNKVVLITNGDLLTTKTGPEIQDQLQTLSQAGLSVLAVSRHHHNPERNADIMGRHIRAERIADALKAAEVNELSMRFICVLQRGGVETVEDVANYLAWSAGQGVTQVNFKELYVSSTTESAYADLEANAYSAKHQVPLKVVLEFAKQNGWKKLAQLPWGAPIFEGSVAGRTMRIAAYTEPSVHWERSHGIARSWNLMSDGQLLASLEDMNSQIEI